jgi:Transposase DDE domain
MGLEECDASLAAALAGGWHVGRHASADAGGGRRKRHDSVGVWRRGWRFFPLARVGARASPRGGKGKEMLLHSLTEGHGMPLANRITPANGDERAQGVPWLDAVKGHTGKRGRPRKHLKVIAADKGYEAQALRQQVRQRGVRFKPSGRLPGSRRRIGAWRCGGSALPPALRRF